MGVPVEDLPVSKAAAAAEKLMKANPPVEEEKVPEKVEKEIEVEQPGETTDGGDEAPVEGEEEGKQADVEETKQQ